jgi:mRNA-degrading endonuclease RelE of RelBE toxin-antitoxin system
MKISGLFTMLMLYSKGRELSGAMTNEEFQTVVLNQLTELAKEQREIRQSLARIEQEQGSKISALFDGYTLRGDQLQILKDHIDERLDNIPNDLSYAFGKVAQHDRNIVQLKKLTK